MEDQNILKHLMDIELNAQLLVDGARAEYEKRLGDAKKAADAKFERDYEAKAKELEADLAKRKSRIQETYQTGISEYERSLESMRADIEGFRKEVAAALTRNG
jgi:hypothetical protein